MQHLALGGIKWDKRDKWEIKEIKDSSDDYQWQKIMLYNWKHGHGTLNVGHSSPHVYSILLLTETTLHAQELLEP